MENKKTKKMLLKNKIKIKNVIIYIYYIIYL